MTPEAQQAILFAVGMLIYYVCAWSHDWYRRGIKRAWCMYCDELQPSADMHWTPLGLYQCGVCMRPTIQELARPVVQAEADKIAHKAMLLTGDYGCFKIPVTVGRK